MSLFPQSEANKQAEEAALAWSSRLAVPHHLAWLDEDYTAARTAVQGLFQPEGFPETHAATDLLWLRDDLGKPYAAWHGEVAGWAAERGRDIAHLHISNTHDGGAHIVLAAYDAQLVGIGIDLVYLPRLRRPDKGRDYLHRFAKQFMSETEYAAFVASAEKDEEAELRMRVAAHFSLMEAASKACGTGLKVGVGMGKPTSLPKRSLGAVQVLPEVDLLFEAEALTRLDYLGATRWEGHWSASADYLLSVVALYRK